MKKVGFFVLFVMIGVFSIFLEKGWAHKGYSSSFAPFAEEFIGTCAGYRCLGGKESLDNPKNSTKDLIPFVNHESKNIFPISLVDVEFFSQENGFDSSYPSIYQSFLILYNKKGFLKKKEPHYLDYLNQGRTLNVFKKSCKRGLLTLADTVLDPLPPLEKNSLLGDFLLRAVTRVQIPEIEFLLGKGASVNYPDEKGNTPLHHILLFFNGDKAFPFSKQGKPIGKNRYALYTILLFTEKSFCVEQYKDLLKRFEEILNILYRRNPDLGIKNGEGKTVSNLLGTVPLKLKGFLSLLEMKQEDPPIASGV